MPKIDNIIKGMPKNALKSEMGNSLQIQPELLPLGNIRV